MNSNHRRVLVLVSILCLAGTALFAGEDEQAVFTLDGPCCFENPRFSGTCQVQAGPEETCGSILAYLNNPNSVGKAYCGNTTVRGGWSKVSCEGASTAEVKTSCESSDPRG